MFGIIACHAGSSSLRYHAVITSYRSSLVSRLQPIAFSWKSDRTADFVLGAETAAHVEPLLVIYNDRDEVEGINSDRRRRSHQCSRRAAEADPAAKASAEEEAFVNPLSRARAKVGILLIAWGCGMFASALGDAYGNWRTTDYISQTFEFACR